MSAPYQNQSDYPDTPTGRAQLWTREFEAARQWSERCRQSGKRTVEAFLDSKRQEGTQDTHLNFYWANVRTLMSMLYGRTPRVTVTRRFADADDDVARVSALMLERLLNADVERYDDGYRDALQLVLGDFLVPGFGSAKVRYWAEFQEQDVPARGQPGTRRYARGFQRKVKASEDACTDYVYWGDQLWSPCRVYGDMRWHAFKLPMTRGSLHERFDASPWLGKTPELRARVVDAIPLNGRLLGEKEEGGDPWSRADVWEIWDKERRETVWFVEGFSRVLDVRKDPLQLAGFFPCPRPLMANALSEEFLPRPDYAMVQDLYEDIHLTATRITELEDALRVAGVYDRTATGIQRLMESSCRNELVPVENFAALSEKGGLDKAISWLPIEQIVQALQVLHEQLAEKQRLLYELTGWSDLLRGAAPDPQQAATTTRAVVRTGSVRVQSLQDEFARYASDLQRLRAEVIVRFFDDETIIRRSNILQTPDRGLAKQAVRMLRQDFLQYVVEVKPEAVALTDFAALKSERTEFLQTFVGLLEAGSRLVQGLGPASAQVMPLVIELVKWTMAGFRGSSTIEGVLDRLLAQAQQMAEQQGGMPQQGQPPDPRVVAQQLKLQGDMQRIAAKAQVDQAQTLLEVDADRQRQAQQMEFNVREEQAKQIVKSRIRPPAAQEPAPRRRGP